MRKSSFNPYRNIKGTTKKGIAVRSKLELNNLELLDKLKIPYSYEKVKIPYEEVKLRHYTPDVVLENGIVIEFKGLFTTKDRLKHKLLKKLYPKLDIRFVFSNPDDKISKSSKTTYASWCKSLNIKYSQGLIPKAWRDEPVNKESLEVLKG